jgi:hypothetical protein
LIREFSKGFTKLSYENLVRWAEQCSLLLRKVDRGDEETEPWLDHAKIDVLDDFEVIGTEDLISISFPVAFQVKTCVINFGLDSHIQMYKLEQNFVYNGE